jgi:acetolactate synthase-1/2/3 large subunit
MPATIRGADIVVRALRLAGIDAVFALSGNHIMPIFDAAFGAPIKLVHARHEAATVYMADGWARLTGRCGVALVSSGAGHANAIGSLPTALGAEVPLLLLSGQAGLSEQGRGGFQELRQVEMAAPACKASRMATDVRAIGHDIAALMRIALSGRPGPVHLSLPVDLLNATVPDTPELWPAAADFQPQPAAADTRAVQSLREAIGAAQRPIVLAGPSLCRGPQAHVLRGLAQASGIPIVGMESPRGLNDPKLGVFAKVLPQADLVVLLGKPCDFTVSFLRPPAVHADARLLVVDPDAPMIERANRELAGRLVGAWLADPLATIREALAQSIAARDAAWQGTVADATAYRPAVWPGEEVPETGLVHPADIARALQTYLGANPDTVLVCDGGEAPQWPQTLQVANRRIINGVAGSIGGAVPFAIGARAATGANVIAVSGDGGFGFHLLELDTAIRHGLPVTVVVANDAAWNAEHQIQLRTYGAERAHSCTLLPTRYDRVVEALGGYGAHVTEARDLLPAIERAVASGRPACINVRTRSLPAPVIR